MKTIVLSGAILLAVAGSAFAQGGHHDHSAMGQGAAAEVEENEATRAFQAANERMHADMAVELTGDADVDFVRSMIPHHQGAIDMAEIVLEHGEDPEIRALAEEIVAAQEAEIAEMRAWLAERGHAE